MVVDQADSIPLQTMDEGTRTLYSERNIRKHPRHAIAFFILGLLNNMMYVVILTAALELLPSQVPTGLLAFANITPALIAKAVFPYWLKGEIQYNTRVWMCTCMAFIGMLTIAFMDTLAFRLMGIAMASFASGLGEVTYLQYATRFPFEIITYSVGWFSSGTGAAGLVGATAWWIVRPLGVKSGLSLLAFLSFGTALAFMIILPHPHHPSRHTNADDTQQALMETQNDNNQEDSRNLDISLSFSHKMRLLKPMLLPYMIPLICVYFAEYTINQGVSPTLLYSIPDSKEHPLLSLVLKSLRDYYPLYQLTYQTFVFISRSYTSIFPLPAIPTKWLWTPAAAQLGLLLLLTSESIFSWFKDSIARSLVIVLVAVEGLAGGSAYVSVMSRIGEFKGYSGGEDMRLRNQEYEFQMGSVSLGDSLGIVLASIVSIPLQVGLCAAQVRRGKDLCTRI